MKRNVQKRKSLQRSPEVSSNFQKTSEVYPNHHSRRDVNDLQFGHVNLNSTICHNRNQKRTSLVGKKISKSLSLSVCEAISFMILSRQLNFPSMFSVNFATLALVDSCEGRMSRQLSNRPLTLLRWIHLSNNIIPKRNVPNWHTRPSSLCSCFLAQGIFWNCDKFQLGDYQLLLRCEKAKAGLVSISGLLLCIQSRIGVHFLSLKHL